MITVTCVWVKGNVDYSVDYVRRLKGMVARHLTVDHHFVCLTDQPWECRKHGVDALTIDTPKDMPGWWSKIELFKPGRFTGRVMSIDLDVLIVASIDEIANFRSSFALIPTAGNWKGRDGLKVIPKYNSSVMVWEPDRQYLRVLYDQWGPDYAKTLWGDQDFIALKRPNEDMMPLEWFPRLSECKPPWPENAKIVLCKKPKNHVAATLYDWFSQEWR